MAAKKRKCKGKTKAGKACKAAPLKPGTEIDGVVVKGDYCRGHDPALPTKTQLTDEDRRRGGEGRRLPRPHELLRERIEENIERWLAPLEAALEEGKPIKIWDGKEHKIVYVGDPKLGMTAMKLAFEQVYGRPRQQVEITGEGGGALRVSEEAFADPKVRKGLDELARRVGDARAGGPGGSGSGD